MAADADPVALTKVRSPLLRSPSPRCPALAPFRRAPSHTRTARAVAATMGKESKRMKQKCIFLNDLKMQNQEEKASKAFNNEIHVRAAACRRAPGSARRIAHR